jgi:hypothetical protein
MPQPRAKQYPALWAGFLLSTPGTGHALRHYGVNVIQYPARIDASWKKRSFIAVPARAFYQVTDFKIETVFKRFFLYWSIHMTIYSLTSVRPQMVDFGSGQGLNVFKTAGIVGYSEE